jgi:hypothetical protein
MLAALLPSAAFAATSPVPKLQEAEYVQALRSELNRYPRVRPALAAKLILVESRGRLDTPDGAAGEIGAMQIRPQTFAYVSRNILHRKDGELNPRHPHHNLAAGVALLNWLLARYDHNESLALIAYNAGIGTADRAKRTIAQGKKARIPATTAAYLRTILSVSAHPAGPQPLVALAEHPQTRSAARRSQSLGGPRFLATKVFSKESLQKHLISSAVLHLHRPLLFDALARTENSRKTSKRETVLLAENSA